MRERKREIERDKESERECMCVRERKREIERDRESERECVCV